MEKIKIVGICGSPHPDGNTAKLIKMVLKGAESAGAETEFISLADKKIYFCYGCYECISKGQCILNDDLNKIRDTMIRCDGLVIGSPTYDREITGQMKTFFDRLWFDIHRETFLGKYAVYVNTHNLTVGHSAGTLRNLSVALGYYVIGSVKSSNLAKFDGKIDGDLNSQRKAFKMGIKLVQNIKQQKKYILQELMRRVFIRPIFKKVEDILSKMQ
ncbi:MAG: flavodoxin family protein [Thermoplasmata archaeon]|nr:MAG: flavodoxin family protein [Thermoplasmata archaeon]